MELEPDWQLFGNDDSEESQMSQFLFLQVEDLFQQHSLNQSLHFGGQNNMLPLQPQIASHFLQISSREHMISQQDQMSFYNDAMLLQQQLPSSSQDEESDSNHHANIDFLISQPNIGYSMNVQQPKQVQQQLLQISQRNQQQKTSEGKKSHSSNSTEVSENNNINTNQEPLKQVEYQIMPLLKNVRVQEIYLIYGEVLIELDSIFEPNILDRQAGYNQFKRVVSAKERNDNGYVEIETETFSKPLRDFDFIVQKVLTIPTTQGQQFANILKQYQELVQHQTANEQQLKQKYSTELLLERNEFCRIKSEEFIGQLDENAMVYFFQTRINPETLEPCNFKQGVSRKLAWVFGCSPEVIGQLFLKHGQLDFTECASKIEMSLFKVLQNFQQMFKEKFAATHGQPSTSEIVQQTLIQMKISTIDNFEIPFQVVISRINLSAEFDARHNIQGLLPECLFLADSKLEAIWMDMLIKHRCDLQVQNENYVSAYIQKNGLFENQEYIDASREFIQKYYSSQNNQDIPKFKRMQPKELNPLSQIFKHLLASSG